MHGFYIQVELSVIKMPVFLSSGTQIQNRRFMIGDHMRSTTDDEGESDLREPKGEPE
jgi:hypothetical protein